MTFAEQAADLGPSYRTNYRPSCTCSAKAKPVLNYARHEIAAPVCGACGARWMLDITTMSSYQPKKVMP